MLSQEENALICNVEPGAPMHDVFKRYWLPCATSDEIATPDSDPVRVTLLGEDYVLFRDTKGKAAVMRERCCHRGASLMLGRVENGGIRCIYHGWKFAADGTILDMPNCSDAAFKTRYRQPAFPVVEAAGMIWVYLGPAERQPPFPDLLFGNAPDSHRISVLGVVGANYLQAMEGFLDSSHLGILHGDSISFAQDSESDGTQMTSLLTQRAPSFELDECEDGLRYAAIRDAAAGDGVKRVARVTAFAFPSLVYIPDGSSAVFTVPATNKTTYIFSINWKEDAAYGSAERAAVMRFTGVDEPAMARGLGRNRHGKPGTALRHNNWLQDREGMRAGRTFSGIPNLLPEDAAVVESAGGIYDRTHENLVPSDVQISRVRRMLMDNLRRVQAGEEARGVAPIAPIRPAIVGIGPDRTWQQAAAAALA